MPSPIAHAIGGLAAAFLVDSIRRRPVLTPALLATSAFAAMAPDLDLLTGSHRTYTHSLGAVFVVGLLSCVVMAARSRLGNAMGAAAILAAAYGSHLVLDWLSKDTREPSGLTALWPFSSEYHQSGWDVFPEISRRYWLLDEFIFSNLRAGVWEIAVMAPLLLIAWVWWSGRTLETKTEEGKTNRAA
jgi:hypothetical protein